MRTGRLRATSAMFEQRGHKISKKALESLWTNFMANGGSGHSGMAMLLPHLINRCEEEGIRYILIAWPGVGYHIKRDPEDEKTSETKTV